MSTQTKVRLKNSGVTGTLLGAAINGFTGTKLSAVLPDDPEQQKRRAERTEITKGGKVVVSPYALGPGERIVLIVRDEDFEVLK